MQIHAVQSCLGEQVHLRAGHAFRGAIQEVKDGPVLAVQMKDLDPSRGIGWNGVIRTRLASRRPPNWLEQGDVLFVARGTRFYATSVEGLPGQAVCGPHLFHLRIRAGRDLMPEFLAWQINQRPFQRALQRAAEGSSQLSVRRPVLESLSIGIPSLPDQQRIVALARLARREVEVQRLLLLNREQQFESIAAAIAGA
ncbi:restriction endonuclease subunit S [Variovorax sp. KK3]|uniref:restriction endonuclease subunit S n=1 Tax=Variovorax sp. KK3 TaxID=1855728 RepID=UPI00097C74AE|nr:restriction endonuclease subunit S [Variovorax sp. KK3]